ncbi:FAD dependent oxidoreductase-domain-containing protein [Dactylonectria estremocensis]|uniref:FAD dependent oxidoreductase-domain-containing protein n=1 Tax=Dactylonectria estremocensis TaxID=1079267 RepID=A0A9P9FC29_9HYPO|nr:FAD dependent oxidoreductase-domain-containing protein [Dactylonectria estremocensis]
MVNPFLRFLALLSPLAAVGQETRSPRHHRHYDLVIVGGTGSGVAAAIQAARLNLSVALLEESAHIGGVAVEGAGGADIDSQTNFQNSLTIGPLVLELYRRVVSAYGPDRLREFDEARANRTKDRSLWRYECHVGEQVILDWLKEESNVDVFTNTSLDGTGNGEGVIKKGTAIRTIITADGQRFSAPYFIDATYEGDLFASAGVNYVVGRESVEEFGEPSAGVQYNSSYSNPQVPVDPYIEQGNPESGVIPTVQDEPLGEAGDGDGRIQAYSWRLCLTNRTENQVPFEKPDNYDSSQYIIYNRYIEAGGKIFTPSIVVPNDKTDLIGSTALGLGFDMPGRTLEYPEANRTIRLHLLKELEDWQRGQLYFLANDPSLPEEVRAEWSGWGYAKDEFVDNNNFPRRMYARGVRRMKRDDIVITTKWHDYDLAPVEVNDPVLVNLWPMDVHSVRRVVKDGAIYDEGFIWNEGPAWKPFLVPFKAIVPHAAQCSNLFTPGSPSSTHLGHGLVRTEHTFTTLGQVSAFAAAIAIKEGSASAEEVPYELLRAQLVEPGFILDVTGNGIPQKVISPTR